MNNVFLMKYKKIHEIMIAIDASTYPIPSSIKKKKLLIPGWRYRSSRRFPVHRWWRSGLLHQLRCWPGWFPAPGCPHSHRSPGTRRNPESPGSERCGWSCWYHWWWWVIFYVMVFTADPDKGFFNAFGLYERFKKVVVSDLIKFTNYAR